MERSPFTKEIHERLIRSVVKKLEEEGYSVRAAHIDHPNGIPRNYGDYIPDVHAIKGIDEVIVEVETCDTILSHKTERQWRTFGSRVGTKFYIIVPCNCKDKAELKKRAMSLSAEIYCGDWHWGNLEQPFEKALMQINHGDD